MSKNDTPDFARLYFQPHGPCGNWNKPHPWHGIFKDNHTTITHFGLYTEWMGEHFLYGWITAITDGTGQGLPPHLRLRFIDD